MGAQPNNETRLAGEIGTPSICAPYLWVPRPVFYVGLIMSLVYLIIRTLSLSRQEIGLIMNADEEWIVEWINERPAQGQEG